MDWIKLENESQINQIKEESSSTPILIFKHSTSCAISSVSLNRLQRKWDWQEMKNFKFYVLDLIRYRPISDLIAKEFGIPHQSPQVLLIQGGQSVYDESHFGIQYSELRQLASQV